MKVISRYQQKPMSLPYLAHAESALEVAGSGNCQEISDLSIREITLMPGKKIISHSHPDSNEIYFLLYGVARMTVEDETIEIHRFDSVAVPAGKIHSLENSGSGETVFLEIGGKSDWKATLSEV